MISYGNMIDKITINFKESLSIKVSVYHLFNKSFIF